MPQDNHIPDIDLDVSDRDVALNRLRHFTVASQINNFNKLVKHNTGIYFQKVPVDPYTKLAAFPYDVAEQLGYFKVDLIPNHVYDMIENEAQLNELLALDVDWDWFLDDRFYYNEEPRFRLTHLANHKYICDMYPPKSVEDIAILIALIRPAKKHLIGEKWELVKEQVFVKEDNKYFFKKSHSVAFAQLVVVHAQIINMVIGNE